MTSDPGEAIPDTLHTDFVKAGQDAFALVPVYRTL